MSLGHGGLTDQVSRKTVLSHYQIEDMHKTKCGIEFRQIELQSQHQHYDSHQCFNFRKGKSKDLPKSTICVDAPDRAIVKARRLMKKMKELCIKAKLELGQADGDDLATLGHKNTGDTSILGGEDSDDG